MQVSALMTHRPVTISPDVTLRRACRLMTKNDLHDIPVVKDAEFIGIITERDILSVTSCSPGAMADLEKPVSDYMTTSAISVSPTMLLNDAVRLLRGRHVGVLPVVKHKRLVGIVTKSDLLSVLAGVVSYCSHRTRVELELPRSLKHFRRLCEIVTNQGARLHRAERHLRSHGRGVDVVLQVSTSVIEKVVDAIEGAGYEIDLIVYER